MEKVSFDGGQYRHLFAERARLVAEMENIVDTANAREEGQRALTEEEQRSFDGLERSVQGIDNALTMARLRATAEAGGGNAGAEFVRMVREGVAGRRVMEFQLGASRKRAAGTQTLDTVEPLVPLHVQDVVEPLEEGLIYNLVGIGLQTGLSGNYVWPVLGTVEATLVGEAVELDDQHIDITKISPVLQRIGITVPVTSQSITQSEGTILDIVNKQLPLAMSRVINRAMFCPEAYSDNFQGPLPNAEAVTFAGAVPTYAELLQMKGTVLKKGVVPNGTMAYVMDEYMKATLEATPRDAGSGLMVIEDGRIAGIPVFCTNYINYDKDGSAVDADHVAFGCWGYEMLGQFGNFRLVVDPYSRAKEDIVQFTLNADWSMATLRQEAFVLGTVTDTP